MGLDTPCIVDDIPHIHTQLRSSGGNIDQWSTANMQPHNQTLLTLQVNGPPGNTTLERKLPDRPAFLGNFSNKTEEDIQRRFVIEADPNLSLNRMKFELQTYRYYQLDNTCIDWKMCVSVFYSVWIVLNVSFQ